MLRKIFRRMRPTGNVARGDASRDRLRRWSVQPKGWKAARGYENGVLVEDGGRTLYLAGQIAWDEDQQLVGAGNFSRQFVQALDNVRDHIARKQAEADVNAEIGDAEIGNKLKKIQAQAGTASARAKLEALKKARDADKAQKAGAAQAVKKQI